MLLTLTSRTRFLLSSIAVLAVARPVVAQYFEARNMGMGGAGTASSHYLAAGFANPALLTHCSDGDSFGLLLPSIGAVVYDKTNLLDDLNTFVDDYQRLNNNSSATPQDYVNLANQLQQLSGRELAANLGLGLMFAVPSHEFGWALHLHSYSDLQAVAQIDPADIIAIGSTGTGGALPPLNSEARIIGAAVTEVGLSLATRFDLAGMGLSIGATPKFQRVDTFNYSVNVNTFDSNNFDSSQYRNDDGNFNLDIGVAFEPGLGLTFGAMARDVIVHQYDTVTTFGERFRYEVGPNLTLGAAWQIGALTVTADAELLRRERFRDQLLSLGVLRLDDDVQYVRLGGEIDLAKWIQLRGGLQHDMQNNIDTAYTAGVGLSPFDLLHVDVAGILVDENSYGGVVQLGFTF